MLGYYKRSLTTLFDQVQTVHRDPYGQTDLCLTVQLRLLRSTIHAEQQIRQLKLSIRGLKKRLATPDPRLSEWEVKGVRRQLSLSQRRVDGYKEVLAIFRDVGDALAFTYIDKWDIKPLAFKEAPGFLSGKKGLRDELNALKTVFASGRVGILNDLTNCLRYGDVSVVKNGDLLVFEVKAGRNRSGRVNRQSEKARRILEYLDTDRTDSLYGHNCEFRRVSLHSQEVDHRNALNALISEAMRQGTACSEVETGLHYMVLAESSPKAMGLIEAVSGRCQGKPIVALTNEIIHANRGYWPFTLSIRSSEALYRFYRNELIVLVLVDSGVVKETFEAHGLKTELRLAEDWSVWLKSTKPEHDGWIAKGISPHFFGRLFAEFLGLHWLLEEAVTSQEQPHT